MWFGIAAAIGNAIGAGIVRTPGDIASALPNAWLFIGVWIIGGIYALSGGSSLAELGAAIPRSGGQYNFSRRGLGEYPGFIVGWSDWLSTCGTAAAVAIVISDYSNHLFPILGGHIKLISSVIIIGFGVLQWRGIRWGSGTQLLTAAMKTTAFLILVIACVLKGGQSHLAAIHSAPSTLHLPSGWPFAAALFVALQAVVYTVDGWDGVIYFGAEVRRFGDPVIRSIMLVSLLSCLNANQLFCSRILYAMSSDGLFFRSFTRVNKGGTPTLSLLLSTIVGVAFVLGSFERVIAMLSFFFVANYTLTYTSLFVLRKREPQMDRPYRAWGYPYTTGVALAGSIAFLIGSIVTDRDNAPLALAILVLSYPVYRALKWVSGRSAIDPT